LQDEFGSLAALLKRHSAREGQPFLIGPLGRPDLQVNAFFTSLRMLPRSGDTNRKYAYTLGAWLNFLARLSPHKTWDKAKAEDIENYKFWRLTDETNPRRVTGGTWHGDLAALDRFYSWASGKYGINNPVERWAQEARYEHRADYQHDASSGKTAEPAGVRDRDVKWFDARGYRRWVDLGLRGVRLDGRDAHGWRGRNDQRDTAFANLLHGTGLRLQEGGSLLLVELPPLKAKRSYYTCRLAEACAKMGRGRKFWMPPSVRDELDQYISVEGERHRAVERARAAGRYDGFPKLRVVEEMRNGKIHLRQVDGTVQVAPIGTLRPNERRCLFRQTPRGLEPLALWLNEDGLPRHHHAWENTFTTGNRRIKRLGIEGFEGTPHMLRHSFALFWFSVGKLAYERRFGHLSEEETRDFREQFGNTWDLVRTLLGHSSIETTRNIYLEPFKDLDVQLLMEAVETADIGAILSSWFWTNDRVRTDPLEGI